MKLSESIWLGVVQGLGEFLPISSSGHLVVFPWAFGFSDPGLSFDVALHFGTLIAILFYFWKEWVLIIQGSVRHLFANSPSTNSPDLKDSQQFRMLCFLIIASIPGALAGYFLDDYVETLFRHPLLVAVNMTLLGGLLLFADRFHRHTKDFSHISFWDSLLIGLSQSLALFPGVSRSGITITTALLRGLDRPTSARFSFLLATPITFGACMLKAPDFFHANPGMNEFVGIAVSALVGFLSIKYLLRFVQTYSYQIFIYYRFLFTAAVVVYFFMR